MPIARKKGEPEKDFISRCMSEIASEYPDQDQRYAVCKSKWDAENMSKLTDTSAKVMAKIVYNEKFKGINLQAAGSEDACWEGYEAIGLKDDGTPNCVPIKMSEDDFADTISDYPESVKNAAKRAVIVGVVKQP